ncbi:hypothetical protein PMAYCL1PPCAC_26961, partial [Pristionchus mayeri]
SMTHSVHFKFAHNGNTRRFAFSGSPSSILQDIRDKVAAIAKIPVEDVKLAWKDVLTPAISQPSIPLETADDLQRAIAHVVKYNGENEQARGKPVCIHLEL